MKVISRKLIYACLVMVMSAFVLSVQSARAIPYPPITVTYTDFEWITNVTFGAINNDSLDEGYGDFTLGMSASVTPGMSYPLSVTIEPTDSEYINAYFDWNRDGDFLDADETVVVATLVATAGPHTVPVLVPAGAVDGDVRMRIVLSWNVPPNSSGTISDGEAEDYTVYVNGPTITASAGANGTITPSGVIQKNSGESQSFTITPDFSYSIIDVLVDGVSVGAVPSYTFNNITASHTISATFGQFFWPPISSNDFSQEWITNVSFEAINNTTGAEGYGDYSGGTPATVSPGMSYPLSVTIQPSTDGDENITAFFDWNHDGDFLDPGEQEVVASLVATAGPHPELPEPPLVVTVPANAVGGETRMRIVLRYFDPPSSSGAIDWGEAEDYAVIVKPVITATAGPNGTITPAGDVAVTSGSTQVFTVTPNVNYHIDSVSGCGGTLLGNTFTTGVVTANCTVTATFAIDTNIVTPSAGANGSISPSVPQTVNYGSTAAFVVTPDANYHIDTVIGCGGTLVGNTYTTGLVTAACSVTATFAIDTFTITPSAGANGSISPSVPQTVNYGATPAFIVTPDANYHIDTISGCGGTLVGNTYTAAAVAADCSVSVTFAINTFTVTPSAGANGSISPSIAQTVDYGATTAFTITPDANYHIDTVSGCSGTLVGNTFTTGAITSDCSVTATFATDTYTVTPSAGANGSISPATPQTVDYGTTTAFTVTPAPNYHVDTISGCGGTLVGNTFTTGAVTADCNVSVTFAIDTFTVTPSAGANGSINPSVTQTVDYGATTAFTVTPDINYHIDTISGCSGTLVGNTYTTGAVTADCSVTVTFAIDTNTVTPNAGANGSISPSTPQVVDYGATTSFVITPDLNYHVDTISGCSGALVGSTYTTGAITADCSVTVTFAIDTFTVTPSAGANGSISPSTPQTVNYGATTAFTVTPDANYHIDTISGCSGTLIGDTYTTGAVAADCSVTVTFAIDTFTVTPSAGANGSISPSTPQTVNYGATPAFTVTPDANYHIDSVTGCGGTLAGNTYTAGAVTADCSISATFAIDTFTVTPSAGANGSISPSTPQTVDYGSTPAFTVTPAPNYHIDTVSGCGGTLVGNTFTAGAVTADCSISATFAIDTFTVTPSAGANGTINPSTPQTVDYGTTQAFTVTPAANYHIDTVSGCGGTLVGNIYTTGVVTTDCSVTATFAIDTYTVTPVAGANGSMSPATPQSVNHGATTAFTITPAVNYHIDTVSGCGGTLVGSIYTTDVVTANCSVTATFAIDTFTVTPSAGANGSISPATPQTVNYGATTAFTVTADTDYHIDTVSGCGGTLVGNTFTTGPVTADCSVTATFAFDTYTVTPVAGANGTMSPPTPQAVTVGTTTAFTVIPDTHYHIDTVTGCGGTLVGNTYTTDAITAACTVTATFAIDTNTVNPDVGPNGSFSPSGAQSVDYGTTTAFTVVPDANYHIDTVSGCGGTLVGDVFTTGAVISGCTITATFAIDTFTVTPSAGPNGSISLDTPQTVDYGSTTAFTITPDANYHIDTVSGCDGTLVGNTYTTGAVSADCSVNATFAIDTYTITAAAGPDGTISPSGEVTVDHGSDQVFTITPDLNYHIEDVMVNGFSVGAVSSYPFTGVTSAHTISATFAIDTFPLNVQLTGSGSGKVSSDVVGIDCDGDCEEVYDYGTEVVLTAEPENGTTFKGWSGDCTGTDLTCTITMDQAKDVSVDFYSFPWNLFLPAIINNSAP